jgi:hypothetical protein
VPSPLLLAIIGAALVAFDQFIAHPDTMPALGYIGLGLLLSASWGALALLVAPLRWLALGWLVLALVPAAALLLAGLVDRFTRAGGGGRGIVLASA